MAGIVHFSNFFRFMESAEVEFLRQRGLSVKLEWEGQRLGFPRVAASCDYLRPAYFEDLLDVDVAVEKVGDKSVTFNFDFSRDGKLLARGKVTSVCCTVEPGNQFRSVPIPATLRAKIED
jgi:YbgC/YbaW family acyl-CoA thioester hydrolase